jgi:alpha-mannosidase
MDKLDIRKKENVRFTFPFNIDCGEMTMDLAWASMRPEKDQLNGANKNFFTIQRWVDISSNDRGVTLVTPDAQLIEVGGMFAESWMKDPTRPWIRTHEPSQKIFSWVMNNSWHTNYKASQDGPATFRYMLDPHKNKLNMEEAKKHGIAVSQPFVVAQGKHEIKNDVLNPQSSPVIITSMRPVENTSGYLVRLFNTSDTYQTINLETWNSGNRQLFLSNAKEEKLDPVSKNLFFGAWEIKTIYVED